MNANTSEVIALGLVAVIVVVLVLVRIVGELAPAAGRKWGLGLPLGMGVLAFSIKLGLVAIIGRFPPPVIETLTANRAERIGMIEGRHGLSLPPSTPTQSRHVWQALPKMAPSPRNNPITPDKVVLGKQLFFDARLSADNSVACANCHELSVEKGGGDGLRTSLGVDGQKGSRNAPTVLNTAFQTRLFWDGRSPTLEDQARHPFVNPIEMGMPSLDAVVARVKGLPEYQVAFADAFPNSTSITIDQITKAIAAYERTLITPNSPYDRFIRGDSTALSERQLRGMALFESTGCVLCHSGPNFSGSHLDRPSAVYRIFPAVPNPDFESKYGFADDLGAANGFDEVTVGVWRIPSLRNVSRTAPYFHNGSVDNLAEAVRIMARVQLNRTLSNDPSDNWQVTWSEKNKQLHVWDHLSISEREIQEIVAFLETLNGDIP